MLEETGLKEDRVISVTIMGIATLALTNGILIFNRLCVYRKDYVFPGVATWLENFMCIMYGFLIGKMVKLSILAIQNKDF